MMQRSPTLVVAVGAAPEFGDIVYRLQYAVRERSVVRILRGKNMQSTAALFNEYAAALQFPYYFGCNWNALDECLADLEWLPGASYLLMMVDASYTLRDDPDDLATFERILDSVGAEWFDTRGVPFHAVLQYTEEELRRRPMHSSVPVLNLAELERYLLTGVR